MAAIRLEAGVPPSDPGPGTRPGQISSQARLRQRTLRSVGVIGGCLDLSGNPLPSGDQAEGGDSSPLMRQRENRIWESGSREGRRWMRGSPFWRDMGSK